VKRTLGDVVALICARSRPPDEQSASLRWLTVDARVARPMRGEEFVRGLLREGLLF
jgi:hypothetical protein